jgi:hypothetical protein
MSEFGNPKTLYELCEQTIEAIEARPMNYYQDAWSADAKLTVAQHLAPKEQHEVCGTAYCRAGWMAAILGETQPKTGALATRLFQEAGISFDDIRELFAATDEWEFYAYNDAFREGAEDDEDDDAIARPGSPEYIKAGVGGLRDFMAEHEATLKKARLVKDENPLCPPERAYRVELSEA